MHWFHHFLTKLSKYLRIKTGDRHYHFVEPCVIDRPFCRMETVYRSHFVEKEVGSLQNGAPQPHPGKGNRLKGCRYLEYVDLVEGPPEGQPGVYPVEAPPPGPHNVWFLLQATGMITPVLALAMLPSHCNVADSDGFNVHIINKYMTAHVR